MYNQFVNEVRELQTKGKHLRQLHNLYQAMGLTGTALGIAAVITSPWATLPLAASAVLYVGSVASEKSRTGRLAPLPYSAEDVSGAAQSALVQGGAAPTLPIRDAHYLSLEDKALFYLVSEQGPRLSQMAQGMDEEQFDYVVGRLVDRLIQHPVFLNNPNVTESALVEAGDVPADYFFQDALSALPHEAKKLVPSSLFEAHPAPKRPMPTPQVNYPDQSVEEDDCDEADYIDVEPTYDYEDESQELENIDGVYLSQLLATSLKSCLVLGAPRAGKGYMVAKALTLLGEHIDVWLIDPKNDPSETHYWSLIKDSQKIRFDVTEVDADVAMVKVDQLFQRWMSAGSSAQRPKLLIIDEAAPGLSTCNKKWFTELMEKCARIASVGPSKGKFVWVLSQSSTGKDLGISGGTKGGYRVCAVGNKNTAQAWYQSISKSMGLSMPRPSLFSESDYIQHDGENWGNSVPFTLPRQAKSTEEEPRRRSEDESETSPILGGTDKTLSDAAKSVAKYLTSEKIAGKKVAVRSLGQAFRSDHRKGLSPHLPFIALHLTTTEPEKFRLYQDSSGPKIATI